MIAILAFHLLFATQPTSTHGSTTRQDKTQQHAQQKKDPPPKTDSSKEETALDDPAYGTASESETAPAAKPAPAAPPGPSRWEMAKPYLLPATLALNTLLLAMLFAAFIFLKGGMQRPLRDLKAQIARLEPKGDHLGLLRNDVSKLQRTIEDLRQAVANQPRLDMPRSSLVGSSRDVVPAEPYAIRREVPRFPVLISDYLSQRAAESTRVKATLADAELFTRDHSGEFYLVDDPDGGPYIVPALGNITTQLFKTYYRSSYDCSTPGAGDLYLVQPALVSVKGDFWRLPSKGTLEVRAS